MIAVRDALDLIDELNPLMRPHIGSERRGIRIVGEFFKAVGALDGARQFQKRRQRGHIFAERVGVDAVSDGLAAETGISAYHADRGAVEAFERENHIKRLVRVSGIAVKFREQSRRLDRRDVVADVGQERIGKLGRRDMGIIPAVKEGQPVKAHTRKFFREAAKKRIVRFLQFASDRAQSLRPVKLSARGKRVSVRVRVKFFERSEDRLVDLSVSARLRADAESVKKNEQRRDVEFFAFCFRDKPVFIFFEQFFDIKSRAFLHFKVAEQPRRRDKARQPQRKAVEIAVASAEPARFSDFG